MLMRLEGISVARVTWLDLKPELSERENRIRLFQLADASQAVMADFEGRSGWVCLHVERGFERAVENVLMRGGIVSYLPCWPATKTARRGNSRRPKIRPGNPVYPSYVMVRCALKTSALLGMEAIRHVYGVIGGSEHPAIISDEIVNRFKDMVESGILDEIEAEKALKPGDVMRVKVGPWVDHFVTIVSIEDDVAVVETRLFGRSHDLPMPLAYLGEV
jgi:transcription termination/antitermination protein NusG